ncbi:hypothetical protein N7491_005458 [Penicillium cf. griseofulvum]|uniref:FAD-dependent oxidoreductase 2 FAD-binding domain-containing protein n=1 Tax=Penicillium cf. griseofulvum TaxID=2972120 RepID=A0A9W9J1W0_9EURO|nr:hypothetical protein N7472_008148 [Penicillium cf. griseofulvum]KAJ5434863.1 hypothetical protein N7491_005458 [Penicillium cf. griseofulvum]
MSLPQKTNILVIGSGNAGLSAALSAVQTNPALRITVIDKSPVSWAGGNSYFTAGAFRTAHNGLHDLLPLAYEVNNRIKFWGGLALKTQDGGKGLVEDELRVVRNAGVDVFFDIAAIALVTDPTSGAVVGVEVVNCGAGTRGKTTIAADAVILAAGGFEANPQLRAQWLGPGWDSARVRGTPYNTGEMLRIARRDVAAKTAGNWSGCHCVAWDADAPMESGNREVSNEFTKSGYPLGIMVNRDGERFVDEGFDMRNYTYAMIGRRVLQQPGQVAFQVWDSRTVGWLREEEYRGEVVRRIEGESLEELAVKCAEVGLLDPGRFVKSVREYNASVEDGDGQKRWDPAVKDGLATRGLAVPKSNWALPIDKPPFLAVKVTAGITFTFGGLAVNPETAAVISETTSDEVPGLYCVGEMIGGIFYDNYPGGSGLTSGTVFGRRAGRAAAEQAGRSGRLERL